MAIRVALRHRTTYQFDRLVNVGPHEIRLRPAPQTRTPILGYSFKVTPAEHFLNWQQDPYGNWVARLVFSERTTKLEVIVGLTADMTVINPFDFFVEPYAETFPFVYAPALAKELIPFLETAPVGARLAAWRDAFRATLKPGDNTVTMLVRLNHELQQQIRYLVRMEPGVQGPERTLEQACGSCRDTGWLLVQILRNLGLAARFASGYLIQLAADQKPLEGPPGPERDFTDLHAWAEVYLPGAGWIGLDATSGLLAGEGHIPLACTADPGNAAPVIGYTDVCNVAFDFEMQVTRVHEDPRVTKPYSDAQWAAIDALGEAVDVDLATHDVRMTQGGEPTFVSVDDMDGAEWNYAALGAKKRNRAEALLKRLKARFAPRRAAALRAGQVVSGRGVAALGARRVLASRRRAAVARRGAARRPAHTGQAHPAPMAQAFATGLAAALGLPTTLVITAYEDVPKLLKDEAALPVNADPLRSRSRRRRASAHASRACCRPAWSSPAVTCCRSRPRRCALLARPAPSGNRARGRCAASDSTPCPAIRRSACACRWGRCLTCCPRRSRPIPRSIRSRRKRRAAAPRFPAPRPQRARAQRQAARGGQDRAHRAGARRPRARVHAAADAPGRLRGAARLPSRTLPRRPSSASSSRAMLRRAMRACRCSTSRPIRV